MSGAVTSYRTARFLTPDYIVRARGGTLSCPLVASNITIVPTEAGSTVSIYDASNAAIVDEAAVTNAAGVATYTVDASLVPDTLQLGMGWRVEWSLLVDGVTTTYRNSAGLIRSELAPVIADADLFRRVSGLDPDGAAPFSSLTTYQDKIDEAWIVIHGKLTGKGSLPHLIMEPTALREPHMLLTLALIFEDFRTRLSEEWKDRATEKYTEFAAAWADLRFEYDTSDSGQSDGRKKRAATPTIWTCARSG